MENYFYDMIPTDELAKLSFVPTIVDLLEKMKNDYANKLALSDTQTTYTYAELYERVGRRRTLLENLGLPKGSKIAVWDRNSIEAIELLLAITTAGYVSVFFPSGLQEMQMLGSLKKFDISALFVRDEFLPMCSKATVKIISTKDIADTFTPSEKTITKDTLAAIYFTGGTTGVPKGCMLTHGNMMRGAHNGIFMPTSVLKEHRYIAFLPLSHIFGTIRGLLSCFYTGATIYVCEDPKKGIGMIPVVKPTCLVLVPGLCEILLTMMKMYGEGFLGGQLEIIISGAANVPPVLIDSFKKLNIKLLQGYGLTESTNLISGNANSCDIPESVGKLYPAQEIRIVNGELWVKGENIMQGYYNDPEATAEAFEDGWFKTGDLVRQDENGFLYIVGRIKNLIILSSGENIVPESIEEKFYQSPMVRDCLVKPLIIQGKEVVGIEILPRKEYFQGESEENIQKKLQELVDIVNKELPSYARIINMKIRTEDFKRTGALKVDRKNS